ncbi:unnamed protein product, partial [Nesidiocoris tenuis]
MKASTMLEHESHRIPVGQAFENHDVLQKRPNPLFHEFHSRPSPNPRELQNCVVRLSDHQSKLTIIRRNDDYQTKLTIIRRLMDHQMKLTIIRRLSDHKTIVISDDCQIIRRLSDH